MLHPQCFANGRSFLIHKICVEHLGRFCFRICIKDLPAQTDRHVYEVTIKKVDVRAFILSALITLFWVEKVCVFFAVLIVL